MSANNKTWGRVLAGIVMLLSAGCKSVEYVPVETVRDYYRTVFVGDTVYQRDSVIINHVGDTVREEHWRDRWHRSVVTDTVRINDTIREPYPVEVPVEVARELTAWAHVKQEVGGLAIGGVLLLVGIAVFRRFKA